MLRIHRERRGLYARHWKALLTAPVAALSAVVLLVTTGTGTAQAEPPKPPSASEAKKQLDELKVAPEGSMDGYDRDKFPHWIDQGGGCDTREAVLKRDGQGVETGSDCYPTKGTWTSPYDDGKWTKPSDLDIDHVVPLAQAWRSGASKWTQKQRQAFANNLEISQLLAVTDNVNQEKSDKDPAQWMPPKKDYHCTYARMWIWVKHETKLTADDAEKKALTKALGTC
ncbi:HNH endonuclease family protein [Streptomyces sp. ODS28]|uniref:HNH endonuclease family protein n=1 Tax=Streptomyces sp. ODS28 TaxID=3136688 RepID=UPI0031E80031